MVGYQGWFRTPNDLADRGWAHWCRGDEMIPENFTVDMWPELTCFEPDELFPAGSVTTRSGKPAQVFSSTAPETVRRHFRWMRQYNIDGAFLQRFATAGSSGAYGHDEWVLCSSSITTPTTSVRSSSSAAAWARGDRSRSLKLSLTGLLVTFAAEA
jgi:hypothetical protein